MSGSTFDPPRGAPHAAGCGTEYRGCAPDCPKDIYERTGQWPKSSDGLRRPIRSLEFPGNTIWLYIGDMESQLGQIVGVLGPSPEHPDLDALEEAAGVGWNATCSVLNVFIHHSVAHQGYGVALYEALARAAQQRLGAPIMSSAYFGASISRDARRTWHSKRLANRITVRGLCATSRS